MTQFEILKGNQMPNFGFKSLLPRCSRAPIYALLVFCLAGSNAVADFSDPFTTEVNSISASEFEIQARGSSGLPLKLLRRAALLKAAQVAIEAKAVAFRIVKSLKRTITSRRSRSIKSFAVSIEIKVSERGQVPLADEKWYNAQNVIDKLEAPLRIELNKFLEQKR
jgi:hypothetical protein